MRLKLRRGFIGRSVPALYLALCVLLGGASGVAAGVISNAFLQILAVALILYALWRARKTGLPKQAMPLLWLLGGYVALVLLSLVPLPASLWQELPGRAPIRDGLALAGIPAKAVPLSLDPRASLVSLLWVLPPLALYLLVIQSSWNERKMLVVAVLLLAVLSVLLGATQMLSGPDSALRFYEITNPTLPVGFFANGNHLVTFLLCSLPFCGYLAARAVGRSKAKRASGLATAATVALFIAVGIVSAGSLAGYGLLILIGAASLLVYRRAAVGRLSKTWLAAVAALFIGFLGFATMGPLQEEAISSKVSDDGGRKEMALTTLEAIQDSLPVGTGLGTFVAVYRPYEGMEKASPTYTNHAHNDYLEFVLELGVPGALLLLVFLAWWTKQSVIAWRSDREGGNLGRAASIAILVVLLHSIVEYPVRPSAIAALMALCCAFLVPPLLRPERRPVEEDAPAPGLRHLEAD